METYRNPEVRAFLLAAGISEASIAQPGSESSEQSLMKWGKGFQLGRYTDRPGSDLENLFTVFTNIADLLVRIHRTDVPGFEKRRMIHGYLNPNTIYVDDHLKARIDFTKAMVMENGGETVTIDDPDPTWMAMEMVLMHRAYPEPTWDTFSLLSMFYWVVVGRRDDQVWEGKCDVARLGSSLRAGASRLLEDLVRPNTYIARELGWDPFMIFQYERAKGSYMLSEMVDELGGSARCLSQYNDSLWRQMTYGFRSSPINDSQRDQLSNKVVRLMHGLSHRPADRPDAKKLAEQFNECLQLIRNGSDTTK